MNFTSPVIHSNRLTLRQVTEKDLPIIQIEFSQWEIIRQMEKTVPWPYPEDGAQSWFNEKVTPAYEQNSESFWAITQTGQDLLIGVINIRSDNPSGNMGFWISRSHQGIGYMTEAIKLVNDWVFANTELDEIVVFNSISNIASRRVKEKTGAEFIKLVPHEYHSGVMEAEMWIVRKKMWIERNQSP